MKALPISSETQANIRRKTIIVVVTLIFFFPLLIPFLYFRYLAVISSRSIPSRKGVIVINSLLNLILSFFFCLPRKIKTTTQQGPHKGRLRYRAQSISRRIPRSAACVRCRVECCARLQQNHGTTESEIEITQRFHIYG